MNFQEALNSIEAKNQQCITGEWLGSLDENTRTEINTAVETLTINKVWRACQLIGFKGSGATWHRHYVKACKCYQA